MFENINVIQLQDFPLKIKEGIELTQDILSETKVGLALCFQYQDSAKNIVAMHSLVTVLAESEDNEILRTGATIIFDYANWEHIPHERQNVITDLNLVEVANYLIGFMGGIFYKQMKELIPDGTPILPLMNNNELIEKMKVEKI